jgi:hypothetical protein
VIARGECGIPASRSVPDRLFGDGLDHEGAIVSELLKPASQLLGSGNCDRTAKRSDREKRVASLLDGCAKCRQRSSGSTGRERLSRQDRTIAVGVTKRPYQPVVV